MLGVCWTLDTLTTMIPSICPFKDLCFLPTTQHLMPACGMPNAVMVDSPIILLLNQYRPKNYQRALAGRALRQSSPVIAKISGISEWKSLSGNDTLNTCVHEFFLLCTNIHTRQTLREITIEALDGSCVFCVPVCLGMFLGCVCGLPLGVLWFSEGYRLKRPGTGYGIMMY